MQITNIQAYILNAMRNGKVLSSLQRGTDEFGVDLSNDYSHIPITTVKAMLRKGLIEEEKRWRVTDNGLIHIQYCVSDFGVSVAIGHSGGMYER